MNERASHEVERSDASGVVAAAARSSAPVRIAVYQPEGVDLLEIDGLTGAAHAETRAELEEILALHDAEIVVFAWEDGLPDFIRRIRPSIRLLHVGTDLPSGLVQSIQEGWDIAHIDDAVSLRQLLRIGADGPAARGDRRRVPQSTLEYDGSEETFEVVDLSNGGVAFRVEARSDVEKYLPGTLLTGLSVRSKGVVALSGVEALVRHVTVDGTHYRVGCAFAVARAAARASVAPIRDRARVVGLLSSALKGSGVLVSGAARGSLRVYLDEACATVGPEGIVAQDVFHKLRPFDMAQGSFEREGLAFQFTSVVAGSDPLVLRAPDVIEQTRVDGAPLFRPSPSAPVRVELRSPLFGVHLRVARELSAARIVVDLEASEVMPLGAQLTSITIHLGAASIRCRGHVAAHEGTGGGATRCSIALVDLDDAARVTLARFVVESRFPGATPSAPEFERVLQFFRDTGFMPADKERVLAPLMPEVRRTFELLTAKPTADFQSVAYYDPNARDEMVGYLSGARAYSRTFFYQHLAGKRGSSAGGPLIMSLTDHLLQLGEYEYFKFFFLKGNPFPTRVLESFGRKVGDPWRCDMRGYAHVMVTTSAPLAGPARAIDVRAASEEDLGAVERFFVTSHRGLLLRADDLTQRRLALGEVDARYRELGLFRRRQVIVACSGDALLGFALAEISSPGLNLSEGLSSARVHVMPEGAGAADDVRSALVRGLQALYAKEGRSVVFALVDPADAPSFARIGAPTVATSLCVTAHASLLPAFFAHVSATGTSGAPKAHLSPHPR